MVDTTPLNQNPEGDEPELENTTAPIVADDSSTTSTAAPVASAAPAESAAPAAPAAPAPPAATVPVVPTVRSKRGLVLAGAIVAAVIVLGGTFGGGVLVGTAVGSHHGYSDAQRGPGMQRGPGQQGGPDMQRGPGQQGDQRGDPGTGTRPDGGPHGGTGTGQGSTNG